MNVEVKKHYFLFGKRGEETSVFLLKTVKTKFGNTKTKFGEAWLYLAGCEGVRDLF
jgi:hypothetical protein